MDPIFVIPALIVGIGVIYMFGHKNKSTVNSIEAAKKRAEQRALERQKITTSSDDEIWNQSFNFSSTQERVVDDKFDGRGELTPEQNNIVDAILEDIDVNYVYDLDKIFIQNNMVEKATPWSTSNK